MIRAIFVSFFLSLASPVLADFVSVPDFNGKTKAEAEAMAEEAGVTLVLEEIEIALPQNSVFDQIPGANAQVAPKSRVLVWLSLGLRLPDFVGMTLDEATRTLEAFDVTYEITEVAECKERKGVVVQSPEAGTLIDTNNTLVFLQNSTLPTASVPNFSGRSYGAYVDDLKRLGFAGVEKTIERTGRNPPRGYECMPPIYSTTILAVPMQGNILCPGTKVEIQTRHHSYQWTDCRKPGEAWK